MTRRRKSASVFSGASSGGHTDEESGNYTLGADRNASLVVGDGYMAPICIGNAVLRRITVVVRTGHPTAPGRGEVAVCPKGSIYFTQFVQQVLFDRYVRRSLHSVTPSSPKDRWTARTDRAGPSGGAWSVPPARDLAARRGWHLPQRRAPISALAGSFRTRAAVCSHKRAANARSTTASWLRGRQRRPRRAVERRLRAPFHHHDQRANRREPGGRLSRRRLHARAPQRDPRGPSNEPDGESAVHGRR